MKEDTRVETHHHEPAPTPWMRLHILIITMYISDIHHVVPNVSCAVLDDIRPALVERCYRASDPQGDCRSSVCSEPDPVALKVPCLIV
jgi:hypothetical protein